MPHVYRKLADLKNRARQIARDEAVPRHLALDEAARRGGFQNYAHARGHLPEGDAAPRHVIEIRQRWREREKRQFGDATVLVALATPLSELIRPHQLVEYLGGCTILDDARIASDGFMRDRSDSQHDVARIARVLQFMDATGLKPSQARRAYPKGDWDNRPPIADHDSCWFDPAARAHILVTEPYPGREVRARDDHTAWEARHGWTTLQASWGSMYGHGTELYLLCPKPYAEILRDKVQRLEAGPAAIATDAAADGSEAATRMAA